MNFETIYKISSPYTMTNLNKMAKLHESVVYINKNNIEGDFVECGVYKGGSVMNMALTQLDFDRRVHIHLYDTFEGMPPPGKHDINHAGVTGSILLRRRPRAMCICNLDQVKKNLAITRYPEEYLHYHKGDVKNTLKFNVPENISLLRLDTDWYESTKIELEVLYPKLVESGILILDDYGYWQGARKATDDYFAMLGINPNFEPMESGISGVIHIKN